jgi:hypothetical protein
MNNKKNKIMTMVFIVSMLILVVSTTYAFFAPQNGGTTSSNAIVTSNTTDLLTFSINRDISFTVTQALFAENGENQSGDATATATLTPNNKTGSATMNYYLYLNIESNPTVYSEANTNEDPELMLQVFDGSNQLVTLTGLGTQKTIKGVTGYDITGVSGLKTLLNNHAISATNNTATIENWRIVITLINLDVNQNDNTGKTITAEIVIRQDEQAFSGTIYRNSENGAKNGTTMLALNNESVYCAYSSGDDTNSCDFSAYWMTQSACESDLLNMGLSGYVCQQETRSFPGIGEYETNVSAIRTKTYNVYCPIGGSNLTCGNNWWYPTEQDCLDDVDTSVYTCTAGTITKPYYLKHVIVSDIVDSTKVCLWYNNHEFCMENWYWDTDEVTTMNKLQTAMETALGTQADGCYSNLDYAHCIFGDFHCYADPGGYVTCYDGSGGCGVYGDGSSVCRW